MKKVLIIANHYKNRSPGQRFRFEQYLNFLRENGFECHLENIITPKDDKYFYKPGNYLRKGWTIGKAILTRIQNIIQIEDYNLVLLFREALPIGSTFIEKTLNQKGVKMIFDFDDAIWLQNVSNANRTFAFLKDAEKTSQLISYCNMVFAGNQYLANYARQFNQNVKIVPTTIDTQEYQRREIEGKKGEICIGWSGSITTIQHFEHALPALKKIKQLFKDKVYFKVIGDGNYENEDIDLKGLPWQKDTELEDLSEIDIGIMPLPDDEWAKGKCGLKGLQYMALEIATIMSPVGVNTEIIQHGLNGYLASTTEEWVHCLSQLVENADLRNKMGQAGRQTVVEKYSVEANKHLYLKYFNEVLEGR